MFTDIVGYTALMGRNVEKALELLRRNREIQMPLINKYGGRWLKEMGDGTLAQFDSAVDSVQCAIEIEKMARKRLGAKLRIGIHLGDVTIENDDVFGDGVNIASRLQSIADPGGIYITESIYEAIRARNDIRCEILGDIQLKNVDHLVRTYYLKGKGLPIPSARKKNELLRLPRKPLFKQTWFYLIVFFVFIAISLVSFWFFSPRLQAIRSIVVLPVENILDNADQKWLERGIHDGLIDELSRIHAFRIISRISSMKYDHTRKTIPEIAQDLKVKNVITASFQTTEDRVNIQVRLIQARPKERQIWERTYENTMSKVPTIYKDFARDVAQELNISLSPRENLYTSWSSEVNPKAYEAYLRGMGYVEGGTESDLKGALDYFHLALEIDSTYALAYYGIKLAWASYRQHGFVPDSITSPIEMKAACKALELDSTLVELQALNAIGNMYYGIIRGDWTDADIRIREVIDLNPNYAFTLAYYGHLLGAIGRRTEGLSYSYQAIELDPYNELIKAVHAMNLKNARKYSEAYEVLQGLLKTDPNQVMGLPALWAVYHERGQFTEAFNVAKKIYTIKGNDLAIQAMEAGYREGGYQLAMQQVAEKMIAVRDSVYFPSWQISTLYTRAGARKEALDWLWKAYEEPDANIVVIGVDPLFDILRDEPRFKELLRKMNLQQN
jgi:TolB-like protein/tetratricopeptide (TPR) repeat protein